MLEHHRRPSVAEKDSPQKRTEKQRNKNPASWGTPWQWAHNVSKPRVSLESRHVMKNFIKLNLTFCCWKHCRQTFCLLRQDASFPLFFLLLSIEIS